MNPSMGCQWNNELIYQHSASQIKCQLSCANNLRGMGFEMEGVARDTLDLSLGLVTLEAHSARVTKMPCAS